MKVVFVIAKNSLREFLRDKFVLITVFISLILIVFSILLGNLSIGEQQRILAHLGLTAIHLAGLGVSIFLGSFVLNREMERQTCLLVLARPVGRAQFILGKYLGIVFLNTIIWAILSVVLFFLLDFAFPFGNCIAVFLGIWFEHAILAGIAVAFSTVLRPSVTMFTTLTVFIAGNWIDEVKFFSSRAKDELFMATSSVIEKVLPNLYQMNWRSVYFLESGVIAQHFFWVLFHALGWVLLLVSAAIFAFRRRDLV